MWTASLRMTTVPRQVHRQNCRATSSLSGGQCDFDQDLFNKVVRLRAHQHLLKQTLALTLNASNLSTQPVDNSFHYVCPLAIDEMPFEQRADSIATNSVVSDSHILTSTEPVADPISSSPQSETIFAPAMASEHEAEQQLENGREDSQAAQYNDASNAEDDTPESDEDCTILEELSTPKRSASGGDLGPARKRNASSGIKDRLRNAKRDDIRFDLGRVKSEDEPVPSTSGYQANQSPPASARRQASEVLLSDNSPMIYTCNWFGELGYAKRCKETFKTSDERREHYKLHPKEVNLFICYSCSISFNSNRAFREHYIELHPEDEALIDGYFDEETGVNEDILAANLMCGFNNCSENCKTNEELLAHRRNHLSSIEIFICGVCDYVFDTPNFLLEHQNEYHNTEHEDAEENLSNESGPSLSQNSDDVLVPTEEVPDPLATLPEFVDPPIQEPPTLSADEGVPAEEHSEPVAVSTEVPPAVQQVQEPTADPIGIAPNRNVHDAVANEGAQVPAAHATCLPAHSTNVQEPVASSSRASTAVQEPVATISEVPDEPKDVKPDINALNAALQPKFSHKCNWPGCKRGFNSELEFKEHRLVHTKEVSVYICSECAPSKAFNSAIAFRRHYLRKHSPLSAPIETSAAVDEVEQSVSISPTCFYCNSEFYNVYDLRNDRHEHLWLIGLYICLNCDVVFDNHNELCMHEEDCQELVESDGDDGLFNSDGCGWFNCPEGQFETPELLEEHRASHTKEVSTFLCLTCRLAFTGAPNFRIHYQTRHPELPFPLTQNVSDMDEMQLDSQICGLYFCDEMIPDKEELIAHRLQHLRDIHIFICTLCRKYFDNQSLLDEHALTCRNAVHRSSTSSSPPDDDDRRDESGSESEETGGEDQHHNLHHHFTHSRSASPEDAPFMMPGTSHSGQRCKWPQCGQTFHLLEQMELKQHHRAHAIELHVYFCATCQVALDGIANYRKHCQDHSFARDVFEESTAESVKCHFPKCHKKGNDKALMWKHLCDHLESIDIFICDACPAYFENDSQSAVIHRTGHCVSKRK